jgi:murein DD-endopeptidase MepM/ murein hydrolase activator NlpD
MKNYAIFCLLAFAFVSSSFVKKPAKKSIKAVSRSMVFPVGSKRSFVGSFWGADRDGGRRSHEGIDIFARRGTAVVALCDGWIVERAFTPRGGKVLWLQSANYAWTAYYAHLDQQLVREGQFVRKGQVIGTVGKTGNARTTPPHLHFGIYTENGAVNPYPYVRHSPKLTVKTAKKKTVKRTKKPVQIKKRRQ